MTIIGVFLNSSFLLVVYKSKSLRTLTNIYLVNLAVADMLYLIYSCSISLAIYFWSPIKNNRGFYQGNHLGCVIEQLLTDSMYYASLFLISIVSFERYLAICHPFRHRALASKTRTWTICISMWLISLPCSIPATLGDGRYVFDCYQYSEKYSYIMKEIAGCTNFEFNHDKYINTADTHDLFEILSLLSRIFR